MNNKVQENLRKEIDAGPIALLMVLWMDRSRKGSPMGIAKFASPTDPRPASISDYDHVEKTAIAEYLRRQTSQK